MADLTRTQGDDENLRAAMGELERALGHVHMIGYDTERGPSGPSLIIARSLISGAATLVRGALEAMGRAD